VAAFGRNGDAVNGPPQQGVVALWHMGVGLPWSTRTGASAVSERVHLRKMLRELAPASLLVMDAGFARYEVLEQMDRRGVSFLVRAGANVHLLRELGLELTDDGETVHLWPLAHRGSRPLRLRRILVRDRGRTMTLLTNASRARLSRRMAVRLYKRRSGIETMYRDLKQTMEHRRMRATSAACPRLELETTLMAYAILGLESVRALRAKRRPARERSAAAGLSAVRWAMRHRPTMKTLRHRLAVAKDTRVRTGSRHDPNWLHKKNDPMPRPARERLATAAERIAATAWRPNSFTALRGTQRRERITPAAPPSPGSTAPGTAAPGTAEPGTTAPGTAAAGTAAPGTAEPQLGVRRRRSPWRAAIRPLERRPK